MFLGSAGLLVNMGNVVGSGAIVVAGIVSGGIIPAVIGAGVACLSVAGTALSVNSVANSLDPNMDSHTRHIVEACFILKLVSRDIAVVEGNNLYYL